VFLMDRDLKVFVASLILLTLVAVSAVIYTGRHIYVVRESLPPPTVTPLNAYVTGGKIYLELYFNSTPPSNLWEERFNCLRSILEGIESLP